MTHDNRGEWTTRHVNAGIQSDMITSWRDRERSGRGKEREREEETKTKEETEKTEETHRNNERAGDSEARHSIWMPLFHAFSLP
mmetsp:Transcript_56583/g.123767  ORF Transcript_56583/g.123767 Transcript_56583/m.123767 type:complete len:84 (-) Transcript_56583:150-401(-)